MANAIEVPVIVRTEGIPKATADLQKIMDALEKQTKVSMSKTGAIESPVTRVRQTRNPGAVPGVLETDKELQNFIKKQTSGLLGTYYKEFNGEEVFRKLQSGAATVTAQGAKPLEDLIKFYGRVEKGLPVTTPDYPKIVDDLRKQSAAAAALRDQVLASLVPQNVLKLNKRAEKAQQEIESFGANLRTRGFDDSGSYLNTVTQFIRSVGQNNSAIGESLKFYEDSLLKGTITPQFFQTGIAGLAKEANSVVSKAQKNTQDLFKGALTENAGLYSKAYESVFNKLLPSGISNKSNVVDQTIAATLRQQVVGGFEKSAADQLKIKRGEFSAARTIASTAKSPTFDIRTLQAELDNAENTVKRRIVTVTDQLRSLKAFATKTKDRDLAATVQQLELAVQGTIKNLNDQLQFEKNQILERARSKAVSKSAITKPAASSTDIAVRKFESEARSFDSTLGKVTDISKGSPRNQGATLQNFVRMSNQIDKAIKDLIDKKFSAAIDTFNAGLAAQGSKASLPTDIFRRILDSKGFSGETTIAGRVNALSQLDEQTIRGQVKSMAPDLNDEQLKAVTDQLIAKTQDILQSYRVLDEVVDQINIKRLQELRAAEEVAISEGRLADATDLRTKQLLVRGIVPAGKSSRIEGKRAEMPLGNLMNLTDDILMQMGFSSKLISNNREDTMRRDVKINNAKKREEDNRSRFEKLAAFAGRFGAVMGFLQATVGQVVFQLQQAVEKANELEKTSATIAAVAGSFDKFSDVVRVATVQQQKFGGSLNEQLQGFTSLVQITRRYNVDLEQLDNVARRLAIIDPLQGFSGAAIALKEFFAGDITSLSRRFEIDRKTLNSVKDIANEAERLQKLDEVLAKIGISNAVLAARAQSTAAEYDRLYGNYQNAVALAGTSLQEFFLNDASALSGWLSKFSDELSQVQLRRERVNEAVSGIAKISDKFRTLRLDFNKDPTGNYFDALSVSINTSAAEMQRLTEETNKYVAAINSTRAEEGKAPIPMFTKSDNAFLALYMQATKLGVNQKNILSARQQDPVASSSSWDMFSQARVRAYSEYTQEELLAIAQLRAGRSQRNPLPDKFTGRVPPAFFAPQGISAGNYLLGEGLVSDSLLSMRLDVDAGRRQLESELNEKLNDSLVRIGKNYSGIPLEMQTADTRAQSAMYNSMYAFQDEGLKQYLATTGFINSSSSIDLLRKTPVEQAKALIAKERADFLFAESPLERVREFDQYIQVLLDIVNAQEAVKASSYDAFVASLPNPYTQMAEDLGKMVKLSTDASFGTERMSQATEFLNSQSKQYNDLLADAVIKQYELADGSDAVAMALVEQNAERLGIVDTSAEAVGSTRAQLEVISQASRKQALYALEADRSVSFLQVMNAEANTFNLSMQQIVELAVEFNKTISGFNMGTIMPMLSLQDQLDFTMAQLTPGSAINQTSGPRNIDEVYSLGAQAIGLIDQISQEEFDRANKTGDDLAKLQKDHNDDLAKAEKDHLKEMEKLAKDYYEEMEQLLRESETSKRGNKADFYENLFGMNLTNEQRSAYIDQYKGYEEEARKLREEGNFTAAEEVLSAGSQEILNQAKYDEEVIQNKDKIKNADEEIADLQKDLAKAKTSDDRAEIQRKIDKANQDRLDAENRIKQIEGLRQLRADADKEEVEQARKKEEQITKDYKQELADRETEYKDKLAEMQKAYDKSVEDKIAGDNKATRNSIANIGLLTQLEVYKGQVSQLATLFATKAPENQIQKQYDLIAASEKSILDQAGPLKPAFEKIFASDDSLKASPAQELDPIVAQQLQSTINNTTELGKNTKAIESLVLTLGKTIVGNRLRVTFAP